jgi:nitroimidazol reductase NimA-like FMN-containing flavoprotein (pyridoxamine 5'-phosphate oxidase superfamily)
MTELPKRKGTRLKGFDYSSNGAYYITLCVKDRHDMLGEIDVGANCVRPHTIHRWKAFVMRRSDREIKDPEEIMKVIDKCDVCRIGLADNDVPYVVPLNFGYEYAGGKLTLYFHGAKEGRKHEIIQKNPVACFEMDCSHKLVVSEDAARYTMEYESVMGNGRISRCADKTEKTHALKQLMKNYAKDKEFEFPDRVVDSVGVLKLEVSDFSGKRHIKT